jgi:MFS transporter, SP family, arabinose:H+ symporter
MVSEAKAAQPGRNVLADLDSRIPTNFYWYLAVLACIGGFLFGYDTSNIGSALGFIPYHLSSFWTGYLVAGASLGAAAGALIAGPLTDHFGRKILLITDAAIYAAGALLSAFTVNWFMLVSSRTLIGLAIGADSAIATAYIAEFAPRSRRGQLSIIQQWMITVGILVSYIVAVIVLKAAPGSAGGADWRLILGLGAIPALVAVALPSHMPESPRWLMLHGRYDDTRKAFGRLGMDVTSEEVRRRGPAGRAGKRAPPQDRVDRGGAPGADRGVPVLHLPADHRDQRAVLLRPDDPAGVLPVRAQRGRRRGRRGGGHRDPGRGQRGRDLLRVPLDRQAGPAPAGHRGYAGMTVFILVAAIGVAYLTGVPQVVLVMVGFSFFITSFAIGVGGTGWLIQGEVFPTAVRGRAAAIGAAVDWLANYALIEAFPAWRTSIGLGWVMVCFAVLCVVAIGFVYKFLPATKALSVEQAVRVYEREAEGSGLGRLAGHPPAVSASHA